MKNDDSKNDSLLLHHVQNYINKEKTNCLYIFYLIISNLSQIINI